MTWLRLAWRLLWLRPLATGLHLVLLALGWAAVAFVLLVGEQIEQRVQRDLAGVDLVVGAKGSPMQIMLAGLFHLDAPTGNIPLASLDALEKHPLVAGVWPIALGDSLGGLRIVGARPDYLGLYQARLANGRVWQGAMEVVLGAEVAARRGLKPGDRVIGSHGLTGGAGEHGEQPYTVVGVLARSGSVLDRLVLTDLSSVWAVHEGAQGAGGAREVSLALVRYRSPLGAALLPRWVNAQAGLQAAAPALETARLLRIVGVGRELLQAFGLLLLSSAVLSVFITLLALVRERQSDLALLRLLGARAGRLALLVGWQALGLVGLALLLGLALAHAGQALLAQVLLAQQSLALEPAFISPFELWLIPAALLLALAAAAAPAWKALRADVTQLLQSPLG